MSQEENIQDQVDEIVDLVSDDFDVTEEEVTEHLEEFYNYGVTGEQARNSTLSKLSNERGVSRNELLDQSNDSSSPMRDIGDGDWGNVEAVVVDLWDADHDSVSYRGLINDGEVSRSFVVWSDDNDSVPDGIPEFEEGGTYLFESVVGNEDDQGRIQLQVNSSSSVSESDAEIETSGGDIEFTGAILDTQGASGLVWRDADSGRVVDSNDGDVEHDLRLILAMDNGEDVYRVHFDRELTEEITGMDLDEAQELAMDAMDREAVISEMLPDLLGRYMTVKGNQRDDYIFVDEYEWEDGTPDVEELLIKARSLA